MKTSFLPLVSGALLLAVLVVSSAIAQDPYQNIPPEQRAKMMEAMKRGGMRPGMMPGQGQPPQGQQKPEEKKEGEKKPDEKKGGSETKTIKRPDKPPTADPNRAKLTPDKDGRVQFSYMGQPWSDVLQDYADAAKLNFNWSELPSDYLNLTTQRKYTLPEARDLLNRHLIPLGFTMITQGESLSVAKIENLDSSLIPEISADDLDSHMPHEFVRVRFTLPPAMDPTKAAEDVKSLLRPNAKVTPLLETKRLLVIDTVGNLRNVRDLIYAEQAAASSVLKPKVYQIRYRRADYIADQVMIVLGMDKDKRQSPQEQMMAQQQQMQQMQQMQEMMQRGGGNKDMAKMMMKDEPKVHITVDRSQNTLLVNAPPDLIPVIDRTIAELDVAKQDFAVGSPGQDNGVRYMEKYSTVTANPETVITTLQDIGNLHPLTQLQSDSKAKTIYAYATQSDHATIKRMIASLDGSGRKAEVIWLPKRLPADQVAGSIMSLLSGEGEKKEENNDFPFYFFGRRNNNEDDEPKTAFRVLPDLENNRLILWATEHEMTEVRTLIAKLSERADGTLIGADRIRVLDNRSPEATQRLLERLQDSWSGENELEIEIPDGGIAPRKEDEAKEKEAEEEKDRVTMRGVSQFRLVQVTTEESATEPVPVKKPKPKVKVTVNDEGQLVIISDDPAAIEQMQELIDQLAPPEPEFRHYRLTYITSEDMKDLLETYFADVLADDSEPILDWWGRVRNNSRDQKEEPATLGKQRKLRIIDDYWTNTLIVSNATPTQLRLIEDMIALYDKKQKPQGFDERQTVTLKIKYSRASDIAKSLKEVYADLLSSKDKEFQGRDGQQGTGIQRSQRYMFGDAEDPIRFEGILSLGVDDVSNSLIVSAPKGVIDSVKETVNVLDQAAQPNTVVEVHEIRGMISPEQLQRAVMRAMSEPWVGGKPVSQLNANQQNQNQDQRREGGWDRRRGRGGRGGGRGGNN
jgi:type II secretory pathway component GspD/PulD (secretin)